MIKTYSIYIYTSCSYAFKNKYEQKKQLKKDRKRKIKVTKISASSLILNKTKKKQGKKIEN